MTALPPSRARDICENYRDGHHQRHEKWTLNTQVTMLSALYRRNSHSCFQSNVKYKRES